MKIKLPASLSVKAIGVFAIVFLTNLAGFLILIFGKLDFLSINWDFLKNFGISSLFREIPAIVEIKLANSSSFGLFVIYALIFLLCYLLLITFFLLEVRKKEKTLKQFIVDIIKISVFIAIYAIFYLVITIFLLLLFALITSVLFSIVVILISLFASNSLNGIIIFILNLILVIIFSFLYFLYFNALVFSISRIFFTGKVKWAFKINYNIFIAGKYFFKLLPISLIINGVLMVNLLLANVVKAGNSMFSENSEIAIFIVKLIILFVYCWLIYFFLVRKLFRTYFLIQKLESNS